MSAVYDMPEHDPKGLKVARPLILALLSWIGGGLAGGAAGAGGGLFGGGGAEVMGAGAAPGEAAGSFTGSFPSASATPSAGGWQNWVSRANSLGGQGGQDSEEEIPFQSPARTDDKLAQVLQRLEEEKLRTSGFHQGFYNG